jgi:hypothetical protein
MTEQRLLGEYISDYGNLETMHNRQRHSSWQFEYLCKMTPTSSESSALILRYLNLFHVLIVHDRCEIKWRTNDATIKLD